MSERTYTDNPMYGGNNPDNCNMVLVEFDASNCIGCPSLTRIAASVVEIRTHEEHTIRSNMLTDHIRMRGNICNGYESDEDTGDSSCTLDAQLQQPRESLTRRIGKQILLALGAMSPVYVPGHIK